MENPYTVIFEKLDSILNRLEALESKPAPAPTEGNTELKLTFPEAVKYVDLSESYMRQLCHKKQIPYYKPRGRRIYFSKPELDEWIFRGRYNEIK